MVFINLLYFLLIFQEAWTLECPHGSGFPFKDKVSGKVICLSPKMTFTTATSKTIIHIDDIISYKDRQADLIAIPVLRDESMVVSGWLLANPEPSDKNVTFLQIYTFSGELLATVKHENESFYFTIEGSEDPLEFYQEKNHLGRWMKFNLICSNRHISFRLDVELLGSKILDLNDPQLFVLIGGSLEGSFTGKIRGLVVSPTTTGLHYGIDEILVNSLFLPELNASQAKQTAFKTKDSMVLGPFNNFSLLTIDLKFVFLNQSLSLFWEECGIFALFMNKAEIGASASLSHNFMKSKTFEFRVQDDVQNSHTSFKAREHLKLSIFNNSETKEFILHVGSSYIYFIKNTDDEISLQFGSHSGLKSCHFFIYDLLIVKGGISTVTESKGMPCVDRDINGLCISCSNQYSMKLPERTCEGTCQSGCSACFHPDFCLSNDTSAVSFPYCFKSYKFGCEECEPGYQLEPEHFCSKICSEGEYPHLDTDTNSFICRNCTIPNCQRCKTSREECQNCTEGYFLHKGECLQECPPNYLKSRNACVDACDSSFYPDQVNRECAPCPLECKGCFSLTQCVDCEIGYSLIDGKCIKISCIKNDKILVGPECAIIPFCDIAVANENNIECSQCLEGYFRYQGNCYDTCPINTFPNKDGVCETCWNPFELENHTSVCNICPKGSYSKNRQNKRPFCQACPLNCDICYEDGANPIFPRCPECTGGLLSQEGICVKECIAPFVSKSKKCNIGNRRCQNWDLLCLRGCKPDDLYYSIIPTKGFCKSCSIKISYLLRHNFSIVDKNRNPIAQIKYKQLFNCQNCKKGCLECDDNKCISCKPGYFLTVFHSCQETCPRGYYPDSSSNLCRQCSPKCLYCTPANICEVCEENYYLRNGTCVHGKDSPAPNWYISPGKSYLTMVGMNGIEETKVQVQTSFLALPCPNILDIMPNISNYTFFAKSFCMNLPTRLDHCHPSCLVCYRGNTNNVLNVLLKSPMELYLVMDVTVHPPCLT